MDIDAPLRTSQRKTKGKAPPRYPAPEQSSRLSSIQSDNSAIRRKAELDLQAKRQLADVELQAQKKIVMLELDVDAIIEEVADSVDNEDCNYGERSQNDILVNQLVQALGRAFGSSHREQVIIKTAVDKDLPVFNGKPEEWISFKTQYDRTTEKHHLDNSDNLYRLRKALKGEAYTAVEFLFNSPENIDAIMQTLQMEFGKPEKIIERLISRVEYVKNPETNKPETIIEFARAVQSLVATVKGHNQTDYLNNIYLLNKFIDKLPMNLRREWIQWYQTETSRTKNLETFEKWISLQKSMACELVKPKDVNYEERHGKKEDRSYKRGSAVAAAGVSEDEKQEKGCVLCKKYGHDLSNCFQFKKKGVNERWEIVKTNKTCIGCLKASKGDNNYHQLKNCKLARQCKMNGCKKTHHSLLHSESYIQALPVQEKCPQSTTQSLPPPAPTNEQIGIGAYIRGSDGPLGVVPVKVKGPHGIKKTYALLDSGASKSYIDGRLAKYVGLNGNELSYTVKGMYDHKTTSTVKIVDLEISGTFHNAKFYKLTDVRASEDLSFDSYSIDVDGVKKKWPYLCKAKAPNLVDARIEVIVGEDDAFLSMHLQVLYADESQPVGKKTPLGWYISGKNLGSKIDGTGYHVCGANDVLHDLVKNYFSLENFGVRHCETSTTVEERKALAILEETFTRNGTKPAVGLLWRNRECNLPESKTAALKRLEGIEKKMLRDQEFANMYSGKFKEYEKKEYIEEVDSINDTKHHPRLWYIPHFGVTNPNKPGKMRLVFDGAAKSHGISLNDMLMKGPDLIRSLPEVLWNFRVHRYVINGDIEDMFHRVSIIDEDQPSQRFLWRKNSEIVEYQMKVMIFGAASSPASAIFVKNKNAEFYKIKYPEASRAIVEDFYVDDVLTGAETVEGAIKLLKEITEICAQANFAVKKWTSNDINIIECVPIDQRAAGAVNIKEKTDIPSERVLGVWWDPGSDTFSFKLNYHKVNPNLLDGQRPTKRQLCSLAMSLFDPFGFVAHFKVKALIILQQTWRNNIGWDDELPNDIFEDWKLWLKELKDITRVKVPRYYSENIKEVNHVTLHTFVDASEVAFAAVCYLVVKDKDETKVSFVAAKARVAPLKKLSIPRKELLAALLGSRLANTIQKGIRIEINSRFFWTDSMTVLCWIRSEATRFKEFVANRVGEIQESTNPSEWRWISTDENVADEATRQNKPTDFEPTSRWFQGPKFLELPEDTWPKEKKKEDGIVAAAIEAKKLQTLPLSKPLIDMKRFSSYNRLLRVVACVVAAINVWMKRRKDKPYKMKKGNLVSLLFRDDFHLAELVLAFLVQRECFEEDIARLKEDTKKRQIMLKNSPLAQLSPIIDADGLLRIKGRIGQAASISLSQQQPLILPARHHLTNLLVMHEHEQNAHQGQATILNNIRRKFWVIGGLHTVKYFCSRCLTCKLGKIQPLIPEMGELPHYRLACRQPPFTFSGVDYFGPMEVTVGRHREKRWGALFVCMVTRAIHIEIANSLSTDDMLMVLSRFVDCRGRPSHIYSDNGTNFVGSSRELKEEQKKLDCEMLLTNAKFQEIKWHFIPPAAPHMGGAWERLIRSVKKTLWNILKTRHPREQTLLTAVKAVENIVNSRPLIGPYSDPGDEATITPNHFVRGHNDEGPSIYAKMETSDEHNRHQWKVAQTLANYFWSRWSRDYLPELLRRGKWHEQNDSIQEGDLVLIVDENAPRNIWIRAVVTKIFPGSDGQVRVVEVSTRNFATKKVTTYRRPVAKICPLGLKMDLGLYSPKSGVGMLQ